MMSDTRARASLLARRFGSLLRNGLIGRRPAAGVPTTAPAGEGPFTCSATAGLLEAGVILRAPSVDPDRGIAADRENSPVRPTRPGALSSGFAICGGVGREVAEADGAGTG